MNNYANLTSVFKGGAALYIYSEVDVIIIIKDSTFQVFLYLFCNTLNSLIGKPYSNGCFERYYRFTLHSINWIS